MCRLLCSSQPGRIRPAQLQALPDLDEVAAVQPRLQWLCARIAAAPVGRGAVTLGSLQPEVTDALRVPTLALAARAPPANAVIGLDRASLPEGLDEWPQFHNATAAGLRLRAGVTHLTRSWVRQHARGTPTAATAGLLFGFGLRGVLSSLRVGDVYSYLHHRHDLTNIAVLLGSAAAAAGTIDASLSKTLRLYVCGMGVEHTRVLPDPLRRDFAAIPWHRAHSIAPLWARCRALRSGISLRSSLAPLTIPCTCRCKCKARCWSVLDSCTVAQRTG